MSWYPDLAEDILKGLYAQIRPALMLFVEAAGYLPDCDLILMQIAYCLEPHLLHPALLVDSMPYTNPEIFLACMNATVRHGWFYKKGRKIGLTDPGQEIMEGVNELCDRLYAKIKALSEPEMERLSDLSNRVIDNIKQQPEPVEKPAFNLKLLLGRCLDKPLIVQLRQQMFILLAFRQDAYVAAWRLHESDGRHWEAFTFIYRGGAGNAAELVAQLPHRNYIERDYASALEKLGARGWITLKAGRYMPTEQAVRIWSEVEGKTDQYFDAAFSALSNTEIEELQSLMQKFAIMLLQVEKLPSKKQPALKLG